MSYEHEHEHENILSAYVHAPRGGRLHALLDPQRVALEFRQSEALHHK